MSGTDQSVQDIALPVNEAARYLGVPARWLRNEIEQGNLPGLRAGRSLLVHAPTIGRLLAERAKSQATQGVQDD